MLHFPFEFVLEISLTGPAWPSARPGPTWDAPGTPTGAPHRCCPRVPPWTPTVFLGGAKRVFWGPQNPSMGSLRFAFVDLLNPQTFAGRAPRVYNLPRDGLDFEFLELPESQIFAQRGTIRFVGVHNAYGRGNLIIPWRPRRLKIDKTWHEKTLTAQV